MYPSCFQHAFHAPLHVFPCVSMSVRVSSHVCSCVPCLSMFCPCLFPCVSVSLSMSLSMSFHVFPCLSVSFSMSFRVSFHVFPCLSVSHSVFFHPSPSLSMSSHVFCITSKIPETRATPTSARSDLHGMYETLTYMVAAMSRGITSFQTYGYF